MKKKSKSLADIAFCAALNSNHLIERNTCDWNSVARAIQREVQKRERIKYNKLKINEQNYCGQSEHEEIMNIINQNY